MNRTMVFTSAAATVLALGGLGLIMLRIMARQARLTSRIDGARHAAGMTGADQFHTEGSLPMRLIAGLGSMMLRSGILSRSTVAGLERTLEAAGLHSSAALGLFVGGKLILLLGLPALAFLGGRLAGVGGFPAQVLVIGAAVLGLLLPDFIAGRLRKSYLKQLVRGMPDALDMMVICAEAGLPLDAAFERVAEETKAANKVVAAELALTSTELRILADRRLALMALGERTGVVDLRRLAVTLVQTLQYGTPLVQALRTLAAEMRHEQLMAFEARAARLPSLLTVPMIVCILPTVFLVVAGPALLQAFRLM
jgi:tight adherence protein C